MRDALVVFDYFEIIYAACLLQCRHAVSDLGGLANLHNFLATFMFLSEIFRFLKDIDIPLFEWGLLSNLMKITSRLQ
jgi:hypothetical protein